MWQCFRVSEIVERIKELRAERGLSQRQLADAIKRTPGLVGQIESGRKNVSPDVAERMVAAFKLRGKRAAEFKEMAARSMPTVEQRVALIEEDIVRLKAARQQAFLADFARSEPESPRAKQINRALAEMFDRLEDERRRLD